MLPTNPQPSASPSRARLTLVARLAIVAGAGVCALALLSWSAHAGGMDLAIVFR